MNPTRAKILGGPLDGLLTAPRALGFVWVGVTTAGEARVYNAPGPGRLLYEVRDDGWKLLYAGDTHRLCEACEVVQPSTEDGKCGGCKGNLIRA